MWYDGSTMTWTKGRRLASKGNVSFTYDAEGHRLTKTANGVEHRYLWQGDRLISEQYGSNTLEFLYDEAGKPVGVSVNGAVFEYITNLQGDILKVVYGGTGDVWAEYTYDAWGRVLTATGNLAAANPLRYRGYFYDTETNLYYVHNRYYDPQLCRWINADSLASTGQGFLGCNMFAYCGNNPVVTKDSSGSLSNRVDVADGAGHGNGLGIVGDFIGYRDVTQEVDDALAPFVSMGHKFSNWRITHPLGSYNIYSHVIAGANKYLTFYYLVKKDSVWDIKVKKVWTSTIGTEYPGFDQKVLYHGRLYTPENLGNYTYGVLGRAFGFPIEVLLGGSYVAAELLTTAKDLNNELGDWWYIVEGYNDLRW